MSILTLQGTRVESESMKNSTRKFMLCAVMILGSFLPIAVQADGRQGHHQSGIIGRVQVEQIGVRLPWQGRVTTHTFQPVAVLPTDADGQFIVNSKPGTYLLNPFVGGDGDATLVGPPVQV